MSKERHDRVPESNDRMDLHISRLFLHSHPFQSSAQVRLFCFPYAGVGASVYREWSQLFPPEIEVCPVQIPGRESRFNEEAFDQIHPLVDWLGEELGPYLRQPFAFFGHSMGTLIGFELTHYLLRHEQRLPECLFISAYRAPHLPSPGPLLSQLPDESFLEGLRRIGGLSEEVLGNAAFIRLLLPALRADFALCETYQYLHREVLPCPLILFGGLDDLRIHRWELLAWQEHTQYPCPPMFFPGNHFFLQIARTALVQAICDKLLFLTKNRTD